MNAEKFNIVFDGALREGVTLDEAKANVAKLYGSNQEHVASLLFSGKRSILKRDLSEEKADKILAVLKSAGLIAMKEAVAPTFSLQVDEIKPASDSGKEEKAETPASSEGWMGTAVNTAAMNRESSNTASTFRSQPSANNQYSAAAMNDAAEEFAELSWFSFEGRLGRLRYFVWWLIPAMVFFFIATFVVVLPIISTLLNDGSFDNVGMGRVLVLVGLSLPLAIFGISLAIRRLHDLNLSGWWYLGLVAIAFIPYLGTIVNFLAALGLLFWPGNEGENDYGLPPPPNPSSLFTAMIVGIVAWIVLSGYFGYSLFSKLEPLIKEKVEMQQK